MYELVYIYAQGIKISKYKTINKCLRFSPPGAELAINMSTVNPLIIGIR